MNIIIVGASDAGKRIAKEAGKFFHDIIFIEKDKHKCDSLTTLDNLDCKPMHGDGTNKKVLEAAMKNRRADVIVAATNKDDTNLFICKLAKNITKNIHLASVLNKENNRALFDDKILLFNPSETPIFIKNKQGYLRGYIEMKTFEEIDGKEERRDYVLIQTFPLPPTVKGKPIDKLFSTKLSSNVSIKMKIDKNGKINIRPEGKTKIEQGDVLIIVVNKKVIRDVLSKISLS